jgi:protease I
MKKTLKHKRVAIIATSGFEQSELEFPKSQLEKEGAHVDILSTELGQIKAWKNGNWSTDVFEVDNRLDKAANNYDMLILPGGVINPDQLRQSRDALAFIIKHYEEDSKPVAAICHGLWTLIDAGLVKGKKVTSYNSLKTDLINAGAYWVDEPVVEDAGIISSRLPQDLDAFNKKIIDTMSLS